jgi:hypothetical protein
MDSNNIVAGERFKPDSTSAIIITGQSSRLYEDLLLFSSGIPSFVSELLAYKVNWKITFVSDAGAYTHLIKETVRRSVGKVQTIFFVITATEFVVPSKKNN